MIEALAELNFHRYFLTAALYLSPFYFMERFIQCPISPRFVPHWWLRLVCLLVLQSILIGLLGSMIPVHLATGSLWADVPPVVRGLAFVLIFTFVHYWTHVARHRFRILWKWCHQMHHSSERFGALVALYAHPFEVIFLYLTLTATLIPAGFDGVTFIFFMQSYLFINAWTHLNIRTPRWLGYIVFRPEQHSAHHAGEDCNFGVIPLWDQLFGTFTNPEHHPERVGFRSDREMTFWQYLAGR